MKKIALCVLLALAAGGILAAQTSTPTTTIRGALGLSNGSIALKSGTITYYVRGLERFIGFIDGLKEGAQVSLEGYAAAPALENQTERLFYPVKLTMNGKDYEVGSPAAGNSGHPLGAGRMGKGDSRRGGR